MSSCRSSSSSEVRCPVDGSAGQSVRYITVAAMTCGPVPRNQDFWLCNGAECEVVYFDSGNATITREQVRAMPGFKSGAEPIICHCFEHSELDVANEVIETGESRILTSVTAAVEAGDCACEVKNPTGRCCLRQIKAVVAEAGPGVEKESE